MPTTRKRSSKTTHANLRPHPTRDKILDAMRASSQPLSPNQLTAIFGDCSLGAVSYHVRTLHEKGIIKLAKEKRVRGAVEHFYVLNKKHAGHLSDPLVDFLKACGALIYTDPVDGTPKMVELNDKTRTQVQAVYDGASAMVKDIVREDAERNAG